jgi:hypothetical protein
MKAAVASNRLSDHVSALAQQVGDGIQADADAQILKAERPAAPAPGTGPKASKGTDGFKRIDVPGLDGKAIVVTSPWTKVDIAPGPSGDQKAAVAAARSLLRAHELSDGRNSRGAALAGALVLSSPYPGMPEKSANAVRDLAKKLDVELTQEDKDALEALGSGKLCGKDVNGLEGLLEKLVKRSAASFTAGGYEEAMGKVLKGLEKNGAFWGSNCRLDRKDDGTGWSCTVNGFSVKPRLKQPTLVYPAVD